jgi:predicted MFS family arabinose efflux permease
VTGLVALVLVSHDSAYTFITRLAEQPAESLPGTISTLLPVFGIASALGVGWPDASVTGPA